MLIEGTHTQARQKNYSPSCVTTPNVTHLVTMATHQLQQTKTPTGRAELILFSLANKLKSWGCLNRLELGCLILDLHKWRRACLPAPDVRHRTCHSSNQSMHRTYLTSPWHVSLATSWRMVIRLRSHVYRILHIPGFSNNAIQMGLVQIHTGNM